MNCPICNSQMSSPVRELFALPSVTSDCRPWRAGRSVVVCSGCGVMRRVLQDGADFGSVYHGYKSYPEPEGRTKKILEFVKDKIPVPAMALDIGCGQGQGIGEIQIQYPDSDVEGYDPYSEGYKNKPSGNKYDLVTMFHVLEHVDDIHEILEYVKSILTTNGHLLIQVPYAVMWPFDLVLADHYWHFNKSSIRYLLQSCGFRILHANNDVIKKELTVLVTPGSVSQPGVFIEEPPIKPLDWIVNYKKFLDNIDDNVAICGTGPAAAWVGSILGDKVICYIDDDEKRLGSFNDRPVFRDVQDTPIVAPFPDWQLISVKENHPQWKLL